MATIVYTGTEPELELEAGVNWWITFRPGVPTEVPDVLAHGAPASGDTADADYQCARSGLLDRPDFQAADAAPPEPVAEAAPPAEPAAPPAQEG